MPRRCRRVALASIALLVVLILVLMGGDVTFLMETPRHLRGSSMEELIHPHNASVPLDAVVSASASLADTREALYLMQSIRRFSRNVELWLLLEASSCMSQKQAQAASQLTVNWMTRSKLSSQHPIVNQHVELAFASMLLPHRSTGILFLPSHALVTRRSFLDLLTRAVPGTRNLQTEPSLLPPLSPSLECARESAVGVRRGYIAFHFRSSHHGGEREAVEVVRETLDSEQCERWLRLHSAAIRSASAAVGDASSPAHLHHALTRSDVSIVMMPPLPSLPTRHKATPTAVALPPLSSPVLGSFASNTSAWLWEASCVAARLSSDLSARFEQSASSALATRDDRRRARVGAALSAADEAATQRVHGVTSVSASNAVVLMLTDLAYYQPLATFLVSLFGSEPPDGVQFDVVVLLAADVAAPVEVSVALRALGVARVVMVDPLSFEGVAEDGFEAPRVASFALNWSVLHVWRLVQYTRVVYCDIDMIVYRSLAPLFHVPFHELGSVRQLRHALHAPPPSIAVPFAAVKNWRSRESVWDVDVFNGGFFVTEPSEPLYQWMRSQAPLFRGKTVGVQMFLNEVFGGAVHVMDELRDNVNSRVYVSRKELWHPQAIRTVHFTWKKPWEEEAAVGGARRRSHRDPLYFYHHVWSALQRSQCWLHDTEDGIA